MKRSRAPSALAAGQTASQTTVTTVTKKAKPTLSIYRSPSANFNNVRAGQGFPKKLTMTHRWRQIIAVNTGAAGARADYVFRANGMYDPSVTGGTHQPYYFTQLSAIYNHFTVIGSKIKVHIKKSDASTTVPTFCNLMINDDSTVTPAMLALMEHPSAKHGLVQGYDQTLVLTNKWSAKKTFGGSVLGNDNLQGSGSADPTEQSCYVLSLDSSINSTQTSVDLLVEIDYIAVWEELKDITNV